MLFYCPLASRKLYSVTADLLADPAATDGQVAATVREVAARDFASDGLEHPAPGRLYLTDYETNAVRRQSPCGADRREPPYRVFRVKTDGTPVRLTG